jgi:ferrous iron transport protein B
VKLPLRGDRPAGLRGRPGAHCPARPSDRIDAVVTHPVWGWLVLAGVMTLLFVSIFTFAQAPMDWIANGNAALANWVKGAMPEGDLRNLLTDGVIGGVGTIVTFLPQILILFFFIGLLENTGYMARAAFIMDRLMSRVGLNGKSFIPLLSSYACAIPGIMATRTIEDPKDRLVTILVAPLMSCSARLPVYLLMIAALLPGDSVPLAPRSASWCSCTRSARLGAFGFAWLFKRTLLKGKPPLMIMELPPYRLPRPEGRAPAHGRAGGPLPEARGHRHPGISIVLWFLAAYPKAPGATPRSSSPRASPAGRATRSSR